jgi:hypothetical protein
MNQTKHGIAEKLIGSTYESMDERTKKVARHITERKHISRDTSKELDVSITFGQRSGCRR